MSLVKDLQRLVSILTPRERRQAVGVAGIMILAAALQVVGVGSVHPFLSLVSDTGALEQGWLRTVYEIGGFDSRGKFLAALGLATLGLVVLANAAMTVSKYAILRFGWGFNHNLSSRLLKAYLDRGYPYFLGRNTSELSKNILQEAQQLNNTVLIPALNFTSNLVISLSLVAFLFYMSPEATLLVLLVIGGGYAVAYILIQKKLATIGEGYVEANEERYQIAGEAFEEVKLVKLLGSEDSFLDEYLDPSRRYSTSLATQKVVTKIPQYAIEVLAFGGMLSVLVFFLWTGRPVQEIIPLMGVFAFAGYRLMPAFRDMLRAVAGFRFNSYLLEQITEDLEGSPASPVRLDDIDPGADGVDPLPFQEGFALEDVTYRYPEADAASVEGIDIDVPKGASVALVGTTGAGKTTVVDLLLGLLEPTEGALVVDGVEVHRGNVRAWQQNIGYVPQDIVLRDASIRRNIAFGVPEDHVDDEKVREAAKVAQIHGFIEGSLPDGYDTEVGERGVRLSGGQRQRIGIARALYHDPEVLVLDEATSDIDSATEAAIARSIQEEADDKTMLLVAHRFATIEDCDRVYVLEDGEVVAQGDYDTLMETDKRFRALAQS